MNPEGQPQVYVGLLGLTVLYRLSKADVDLIAIRRRESEGQKQGNPAHEGERVPMIVTATWSAGDNVNGQVILDGDDSLWVTSVNRGDQPGEWDFR